LIFGLGPHDDKLILVSEIFAACGAYLLCRQRCAARTNAGRRSHLILSPKVGPHGPLTLRIGASEVPACTCAASSTQPLPTRHDPLRLLSIEAVGPFRGQARPEPIGDIGQRVHWSSSSSLKLQRYRTGIQETDSFRVGLEGEFAVCVAYKIERGRQLRRPLFSKCVFFFDGLSAAIFGPIPALF
jgi:hypothetical protein